MPTGQKAPTGHGTQTSADVWFVNVLYVPALQFTYVGDTSTNDGCAMATGTQSGTVTRMRFSILDTGKYEERRPSERVLT